MSRLHNSKLRMPWILPRIDENDWLYGKDVAFKDLNTQPTLFG